MKKPYQKTMYACFIGYIVQAIVNNFVPLLFVTFQTDYRVPLQKITLLICLPGSLTGLATGRLFCWPTALQLPG